MKLLLSRMPTNSNALYGLYIGSAAGYALSETLKYLENTNRPPTISQRPSVAYPTKSQSLIEEKESMLLALFFMDMCSTYENHSMSEILTWDTDPYGNWEKYHGFIQWIFPTPFPSHHSDPSRIPPILSKKALAAIKDFHGGYLNLVTLFLKFIGIIFDDESMQIVNPSTINLLKLPEKKHNFLRITRLLQSLRCFGYDVIAAKLLKILMTDAIDPPQESLGYWKVAVFQNDPWINISQRHEYFSKNDLHVKTLLNQFIDESKGNDDKILLFLKKQSEVSSKTIKPEAPATIPPPGPRYPFWSRFIKGW